MWLIFLLLDESVFQVYLKIAHQTIFTNAVEYSESIRIVGVLWFEIFILFIFGFIFFKRDESCIGFSNDL